MTNNKNFLNTTNWSDRTFEKVCSDFAKDFGEAVGKGVKITPEHIDFWFEQKNPAFSPKDREAVTNAFYTGVGLVALALVL